MWMVVGWCADIYISIWINDGINATVGHCTNRTGSDVDVRSILISQPLGATLLLDFWIKLSKIDKTGH